MAVRFTRRRAALVALGIAVVVIAPIVLWTTVWRSGNDVTGEALLLQAQGELAREHFELAESLVAQIDRTDGAWPRGQLIAGEAAQGDGRFEDAIDYYDSVPRDGSETAIRASFLLAELAFHVGHLTRAEQACAYVLKKTPGHIAARERMAFLLGVTGRRWEALPHFTFLIRSTSWNLDTLALQGDLERPLEQPEYLQRCSRTAPNDPLVILGRGSHAFDEGHSDKARRLLRDVIARGPHLLAAHAMLGELLVDTDGREFLDWHAGLPAAADNYTDIWFVRGLWARRSGDLRVAALCFWQAVRIAPTHRRANYQLGQVLTSLGEPAGEDFSDRAAHFSALTQALDDVLKSRGHNIVAMRRVTELMETTGRLREAWAWAITAARTFPNVQWPRTVVKRLSPQIGPDSPRTIDSANLTLKHDLSDWPNHEQLLRQHERAAQEDSRTAATRSVRRHSAQEPTASADQSNRGHQSLNRDISIRFEEEFNSGIDFVYVNADDPSTKGARIFEQNGGGVAVIDYDQDGRPDLYFNQGAEWEHGATEPSVSETTTDRIYRNFGGAAFVEVTHNACLGGHGYGQGCSAGDFDNDGFPDLYVANIGGNRLYRNNGDGTFSDVTQTCGLEGADWTTSCVIVDLNTDGHPDLFDATYVTGQEIYTAFCKGKMCSPKNFDGLPDRLYLSRGDGTFELVKHLTPDSKASKGLGVVAADIHTRGRPSLFVGVDQVPNFLLRNRPSNDRFNIRLEDEGFISGLAFNKDGLAMACMGIAVDDIDADGRIDFFVANFKDEFHNLYLQDAPGLFVDVANAAGVATAGLPFVSWGAQFLDADLNGDPDLVVVNGHIDDYREEGGQYHMRPQFLYNLGKARFTELRGREIGPFFEQKILGRALSRLDWNGDGRMDFAVSKLGDRAALVTNRSQGIGSFLNVCVRATSTARDAIGTMVEVATDERRWIKQLVAGDGYQASNERMLQFGLGDTRRVKKLRVDWPSGQSCILQDLPVNVTIALIEGGSHAIREKENRERTWIHPRRKAEITQGSD